LRQAALVDLAAVNGAGRVHLGLQYTPPSPAWADVQTIVGTWLSLVERTLGVGEVASSNLVVPTIFSRRCNELLAQLLIRLRLTFAYVGAEY
jgi:hypothetical protein